MNLLTIIREEVVKYINEVGLCHSPETGFFVKCNKGSVYSLTRKGASDNNINNKYSQRGMVVDKEKDKPPRLTSKFGINTSDKKAAGRKKISGQDISPKYSVSKYPEQYKEELTKFKSFPDMWYNMNNLVDAITLLDEGGMDCSACVKCRGQWQASFLRALNATNLAAQGKLG